MHDVSRKIFFRLYSVNWPISLSDGHYYLRLGVINYKIKLSFLIKPFSYINNHGKAKFEYLKNKKGFLDEIKNIINHFWRVFIEANKKNSFRRQKGSDFNFFKCMCKRQIVTGITSSSIFIRHLFVYSCGPLVNWNTSQQAFIVQS